MLWAALEATIVAFRLVLGKISTHRILEARLAVKEYLRVFDQTLRLGSKISSPMEHSQQMIRLSIKV